MERAWTYLRERYVNLTQLPASRRCPSKRTFAIIGSALLLAIALIGAVVLGLGARSWEQHGSVERLHGRLVYQANIHGGISAFTGGHGNDYWQYCGFRANRSITVVNLGICGPPQGGHYRILMKLVEEYEESELNAEPVALGETCALSYAEPEVGVYLVSFMEPVRVKAYTWYRAYVHISEGPPSTYYGTQGRTSEDVSCGDGCSVHFQFSFYDGQPYSLGFQV